MSLPHALLTALAENSGSGLELAKRFDKSIGYFWTASHQQIYRELKRMEATGLIRSVAVPAARGGKRIYEILPAGYDELRRWATLEDQPSPHRESFMVRLRAEAAVGPLGMQPTILSRLAVHRQNLAQYLEIERRDFEGDQREPAAELQHLILTSGIRIEQGWIAFLEEALEIVRR